MLSRGPMCTLIILRRPDHAWPVLIGANRDELLQRPWSPPGRHWPDRSDVVAGQDREAGGSWLGMNEHGVVAGILNRTGSLGPQAGKRSRGELVLEALDHPDACDAAAALSALDGRAWRTFNLIVADNRDAFWLRHRDPVRGALEVIPLETGLSMIASREVNDPASPRIARSLDAFRAAPPPDPETADWAAWMRLLSDRTRHHEHDPSSAMNITAGWGYGTVCSSLIALPAPGARTPVWLFSDGPPDSAPWRPVALGAGEVRTAGRTLS